MTQKQLLEQLKTLKEIKPRKEWAVLLKSQILAEQKTAPVQAKPAGFMDVILSVFATRKLAYAFAALLLLVAGAFGLLKLMPAGDAAKQTASVIGVKQQTVAIKNKIKTVAKDLAQNLKDNPTQDPQTIRTLAKTLADMPGDVSSSPDVKNLMQTVVQTEISDLQKTTLTDSQKNTLVQAQDLYNQGKYSDALILLMANN